MTEIGKLKSLVPFLIALGAIGLTCVRTLMAGPVFWNEVLPSVPYSFKYFYEADIVVVATVREAAFSSSHQFQGYEIANLEIKSFLKGNKDSLPDGKARLLLAGHAVEAQHAKYRSYVGRPPIPSRNTTSIFYLKQFGSSRAYFLVSELGSQFEVSDLKGVERIDKILEEPHKYHTGDYPTRLAAAYALAVTFTKGDAPHIKTVMRQSVIHRDYNDFNKLLHFLDFSLVGEQEMRVFEEAIFEWGDFDAYMLKYLIRKLHLAGKLSENHYQRLNNHPRKDIWEPQDRWLLWDSR